MAIELEEERYVRELLLSRFNVHLRKIVESKVSRVRTPDFELVDGDHRLAFAEVKCLGFVPRTQENGWTQEEGSPFVVRDDNATKRVATFIHKAWSQLAAHPAPKILILVNDEHGVDVHDLEEACNGSLPYGDAVTGYVLNQAFSKTNTYRRIIDEVGKIDLYLWIDRCYGTGKVVQVFPAGAPAFTETRTEAPMFRCTTQAGYDLARQLFGCPDIVPAVAPIETPDPRKGEGT